MPLDPKRFQVRGLRLDELGCLPRALLDSNVVLGR
jgi:hypothetical protein